ncbi:unnamed protein product [Gongylonema pulchrum]|uniref:Peptidase S1 domain-containing protein n=1 Tax=Gongylonema pulchrum TaxID=637853 RepID=A0A183DP96_9BILA|nr:unnamed protein product [Gongylonema pulchrum]
MMQSADTSVAKLHIGSVDLEVDSHICLGQEVNMPQDFEAPRHKIKAFGWDNSEVGDLSGCPFIADRHQYSRALVAGVRCSRNDALPTTGRREFDVTSNHWFRRRLIKHEKIGTFEFEVFQNTGVLDAKISLGEQRKVVLLLCPESTTPVMQGNAYKCAAQ